MLSKATSNRQVAPDSAEQYTVLRADVGLCDEMLCFLSRRVQANFGERDAPAMLATSTKLCCSVWFRTNLTMSPVQPWRAA